MATTKFQYLKDLERRLEEDIRWCSMHQQWASLERAEERLEKVRRELQTLN